MSKSQLVLYALIGATIGTLIGSVISVYIESFLKKFLKKWNENRNYVKRVKIDRKLYSNSAKGKIS